MDALQAKHSSSFGYKLQTTPTIDQLANVGISFSQAISPASWTVPTYLSIFTSTFPSVHGLTNRYEVFNEREKKTANFAISNPQLNTMAEIFKAEGYATGAFTGDAGISAILGYSKGFDVFKDDIQFGGLDHSVDLAEKWLESVRTGPFFLFLHGYDSHGQYKIANGYKSRFWNAKQKTAFTGTREEQGQLRERSLKGENLTASLSEADRKFWNAWYDGKIYDADLRLSRFIKKLDSLKLREKTIIILFSDHGTEFFEHGGIDHGHSLYDELIQVPLVISVPKAKYKNIHSSAQVSTLDLLPTAMDLAGVQISASLKNQIVGTTLTPFIMGEKSSGHDAFSETDYRNYTHKRSIRTKEGWKLIVTLETGAAELYNWKKDPKERVNLLDKEAKIASALKEKLMRHLEKTLAPRGVNLEKECLPVYKGQCEK